MFAYLAFSLTLPKTKHAPSVRDSQVFFVRFFLTPHVIQTLFLAHVRTYPKQKNTLFTYLIWNCKLSTINSVKSMLNKQTISFAFNNLKNETTLLFQPLYISCLFLLLKHDTFFQFLLVLFARKKYVNLIYLCIKFHERVYTMRYSFLSFNFFPTENLFGETEFFYLYPNVRVRDCTLN